MAILGKARRTEALTEREQKRAHLKSDRLLQVRQEPSLSGAPFDTCPIPASLAVGLEPNHSH